MRINEIDQTMDWMVWHAALAEPIVWEVEHTRREASLLVTMRTRGYSVTGNETYVALATINNYASLPLEKTSDGTYFVRVSSE